MTTLEEFLNKALNEGNDDNIPQPQDCSNLSVDAIVATIHSIVNCRRDYPLFHTTIIKRML